MKNNNNYMYISKLTTSRSLNPNSMEYWDRALVEVTLNEGDDPDAANALSQTATIKYLAAMPPPQTPTMQVDKKELTGNIIEDIKTCTDITVLESYKLLVRNQPGAMEIYNQQLSKLLNG